MSEPIRPSEAWTAYKSVHDHVQRVGMVNSETDDALRLLENYLRQEMENAK